MEHKGIIQVPAFNTKYYVVGRPIEYIKIQTQNICLCGVIQLVDHQEMKIVTVDENGKIETVNVSLLEVSRGNVRLNYEPPIGWDSPFIP